MVSHTSPPLVPFPVLSTGSWSGPDISPRATCKVDAGLLNMWRKVPSGLPCRRITFVSRGLLCPEDGDVVAWGALGFCLVWSDWRQAVTQLWLSVPSSLRWEFCLADLGSLLRALRVGSRPWGFLLKDRWRCPFRLSDSYHLVCRGLFFPSSSVQAVLFSSVLPLGISLCYVCPFSSC